MVTMYYITLLYPVSMLTFVNAFSDISTDVSGYEVAVPWILCQNYHNKLFYFVKSNN